MTSIEKAVTAKVAAQSGGEDVVALWKRLWAVYEESGREGVEAFLGELVELPQEGEGGAAA